ncbi:MAG TPA: hypothetical protein GXX75_19435 [Clostridiales bacterium]|nr:hypothetical protein [Clostridiales bacterium]
MKKRRIFALLMLVVMSMTFFISCKSKGDSTQQPDKPGTTEGATKAPAQEGGEGTGEAVLPELPNNTLSITVNTANFGTDAQGTAVQEEWQRMMEEYLGCKLDITWNMTPWQDFRTNEAVLLQSGDIPDVSTYSQGTLVNEYGADGVVLDISKYTQYMKYYPEFIKSTNGGEKYVFNENGSSYYFMDGFVNPENIEGAQSFTAFAYRFDLLEKFNLKPATTLDEFTKLCADIKELIDKGEIDAKYVMSNSDKNYAFYRGFVGIFHTWDTTYWNGEKWSFGPIEDNFREMLKYINSLYAAGYIDPEFGTDDGATATEKAVKGSNVIQPTLWAGMPRMWNTQSTVDGMKWGLAFLPENATYGTPWKWGSRQPGKSLSNSMGIIISADTEYPEWVVKMIDYQYSDEMIEMMNWGIKDETYTVDASGDHKFADVILNAEDPVQAAANYGIMSSSACRTGIPFTPLTFEAMTEQIPTEPWWNPTDGYYEGKYWHESGKIGGPASVSPFDRPPVLNLTDKQATEKAELTTTCELFARENALKFITGEMDINDDAAWQKYVDGVKSQVSDFDGKLQMMQDGSDLSSIGK